MIRRGWGNLTPFGRASLIGTVLLVASAISLVAGLLSEIERTRAKRPNGLPRRDRVYVLPSAAKQEAA